MAEGSLQSRRRFPHFLFKSDLKITSYEFFLSIKSIKVYQPIQPGDVEKTFADTTKLEKWINYKPEINLETGVKKFAEWFMNYYS